MLFTISHISAQIPNASFENWEQENTWEVPTNWTTNNDENNFISVTKVESLTDGDFAMKVETNGPSFEGLAPGIASCIFLPNGNSNTLEFSYRIDSLIAGGNVEAIILQLKNDHFNQIGYWKLDVVTQGIESLQIPLNSINSDSIKIEIRANSLLTPLGYEGYAEIIVDRLELELTSSSTNPKKSKIKLFPNPSNGHFTIENCNGCKYQAYNTNGKIVKQGVILDRQVEIDDVGIYSLYIQKSNYRIQKKVIVQ